MFLRTLRNLSNVFRIMFQEDCILYVLVIGSVKEGTGSCESWAMVDTRLSGSQRTISKCHSEPTSPGSNWLFASESESFVALKIVRADTDSEKEVQHYNILRANADQHPGSSCVMMMRNPFSIQGPNVNHNCLAYEVLGPSIAHVLEASDGLTTSYLALPCARKIVY